MWLSPWMVMCLCRWPALTSVGDCGKESADGTGGRLEECRLVYGGVPGGHGKIVLCFSLVI